MADRIDMDNLVLHVGDKRHEGWKAITVVRSMEQAAHSFSLTMTDASLNGNRLAKLRIADAVKLTIDNERLITGTIEDVAPQYDYQSHEIRVGGYSKVYDLLISSNVGKTFEHRDLLWIANRLCKPYGIEVTADVDVGKKFARITIDDGEPIYEFLEQAARYRGVRLLSDARGNVLITRAGQQRVKTPLILGQNILKASATFSSRDLFSHYIMVAQQSALGGNDPAGASQVLASVSDAERLGGRYRPLCLRSDSPADKTACQRRALWERNTRYGRGQSVVYTVAGWRQQPKGPLWQPNSRVRVRDEWLGIVDEDRLIVEVRFLLDEQGHRTELLVMPPEAMDITELPQPDEGNV